MHDDHTFSHLRSLLQRSPSLDVWYALNALLDPLDSPPAALIDYASAHLSRWPSHLRRDASDDVFDWLEDRRPSWALSLLNATMITTAEHLRRLPLAPFAAHIAHLQIDIHKQLTQRQLSDTLHRLPALESITLGGHRNFSNASPDALIKMLTQRWPPRLTSLSLNGHISPRTARLLAAKLGRLKQLTVTLTAETAAILLLAPGLRSLRNLSISGSDGPAIAALIIQNPELAGLTSLTIGGLINDALWPLLQAPHLQQLEQLDIHVEALSPHVAQQLTTAPWPPHIVLKNIDWLPLDPDDVARLAQHNAMSRVTTMFACDAALLESPHLQGLRRLSSWDEDITRAISQNRSLSALHTLWLRERPVAVEELALLASSTHLTGLRDLTLQDTKLTAAHLRVLATAPWLPQLEALDLGSNDLDDEAIAILAPSLPNTLRELILSTNNITAAGLTALLESPCIAHIERLGLNHNPLGPDGVKLLASHRALATMYGRTGRGNTDWGMFDGMEMDDDALDSILNSPHIKPLNSLQLGFNKITSNGHMMLAGHPLMRSLRSLGVHCEPETLLDMLSSPNSASLRSLSIFRSDRISADTWHIMANLSHLSPTLRSRLREQYKMTRRQETYRTERRR
jgi:hypothetical protein